MRTSKQVRNENEQMRREIENLRRAGTHSQEETRNEETRL